MANSEKIRKRLEGLKAKIEAFLKLHKNPYDSSVHNELATKLERINEVLRKITHGADKNEAGMCTPDMGGNDKPKDAGNSNPSMGGNDKPKDAGNNNPSMGGDDKPKDAGNNLSRTISASVGKGGANKEEDVRTIQGWLNKNGASLEVNGKADKKLIREIKKFQRRIGQTRPDGKVDPGYNTFKGLIGEIPVGPQSTGVSSIIQGGESGAAGYNAYNRGTVGNKTRGPNGSRKLVEMTLATIMSNQKRPKSHPDYLFAVGKYQMIPDTLADGVKRLKLDTSLKYDANTQELLFSGYLMDKKRPQISAYIKGQPGSSTRAAGLAAAQEWASIACPPNTTRKGIDVSGKSYYDGIGGNSAHITHEDFIATLNEAKETYRQNLAKGMSDADAYRAAVSGVEQSANAGGSGAAGDGQDKGANGAAGDGQDKGANGAAGDGQDKGTNGAASGKMISASVGKKGANKETDVCIVQELLNKQGESLKVDGKCGVKTIKAIKRFQAAHFSWKPDGLISVGGKTWQALSGNTSDEQGQSGGAPAAGSAGKPKWVSVAEGEIGVKEIKGKQHNPRVLEYHATTGGFKDDETPWCASFVNWVMQKAGQGGTGSASAMSWAGYGKRIDKPAYGAIGVISYGKGKGHVGIIVGKQGGSLLMLGGNQGNMVKISKYAVGKFHAFVVPKGYDVPASAYAFGEAQGDFGAEGDFSSTR